MTVESISLVTSIVEEALQSPVMICFKRSKTEIVNVMVLLRESECAHDLLLRGSGQGRIIRIKDIYLLQNESRDDH